MCLNCVHFIIKLLKESPADICGKNKEPRHTAETLRSYEGEDSESFINYLYIILQAKCVYSVFKL